MAEKSQITVSRLLSFKVAATSRPQLTTGLTAERTGVGVYCLHIDFHRGTGPGNFLSKKEKPGLLCRSRRDPPRRPREETTEKLKLQSEKKTQISFRWLPLCIQRAHDTDPNNLLTCSSKVLVTTTRPIGSASFHVIPFL